jgi:hypothetical protein
MYSLLFLLFLVLMLWHISYREGAEGGGSVGGSSEPVGVPSVPVGVSSVPVGVSSVPGSGSPQMSTCDSINAQNKANLDDLTTKLNEAIALSDTIKTMDATLANNTKRIDEIINTQLTALITKK